MIPRALVLLLLALTVTIAAAAGPLSVAFVARWGGETRELASAIVTDRQGGVFVAGSTYSTDFPVTTTVQATGNSCAFATKLSAESGAAVYSTALCTKDTTSGHAAAPGLNGELWVAGATDGDALPVTADAAQKTFGGSASSTGSGDAMLIRLSADGRTLRYATYFGGADDERANALVADDDGGVWMAGRAGRRGFLAHYDARGHLTKSKPTDQEIVALARVDGTHLVLVAERSLERFETTAAVSTGVSGWVVRGTDFGTTGSLRLRAAVAVGGGKLVAAGDAAPCPGGHGLADGWMVLQSSDLSAAEPRCIGGSGVDEIHGIAAGNDGSVWITGLTGSSDFPVTAVGPGTHPEHEAQAFVANVDPATGTIKVATLLGANSSPRRDISRGYGIATASDGAIFATGETTGSRLLLPTKGAFRETQSFTSTDVYVVKLR